MIFAVLARPGVLAHYGRLAHRDMQSLQSADENVAHEDFDHGGSSGYHVNPNCVHHLYHHHYRRELLIIASPLLLLVVGFL